MLYDSNGFKPYMYVLFFKTCPCVTHIYIYSIGPMPKSIEYRFLATSEVSKTVEAVFTGHVRLLARTCPSLRFQPLYKGAEYPFEP
jgi:hypothetical protein